MFQTELLEKIKTHVLLSAIFPPPPKNRALYEIMWKNIVQPDSPQMAIQYGAYALHAG